ncbi:MAG TPA: glutamate--tRNA ligase [Candidatus Pacearchaeota archaeon]|nr:glutamate--tRNA ligase [Candidatus Pacearchaeota archaeon]HPR80166.1 glutamate--tRNA ligase [Candidatus Pacearchaeota archaeon]
MIAKKEEKRIRTRFAPSPTGHLHIGTIRTALFPFLFARKNKGTFILRIEDTDLERSKKEWEDELLMGLNWMGINWDEGPVVNSLDYIGGHSPYRQSERTKIYRKYLEQMLKDGHAYYCFCSKEEVEAQKQYLMSIGESPVYRGACRDLPKETVEKYLKEGKPSVIRFRTPVDTKVSFNDLIRGEIEVSTETMGDFVLAKDLDTALFNFTCAVDDVEMEITHVIRGEDHIPNTPKQILIIRALGFEEPKYAHLSLILGTDKKKLSKRTSKTSLIDYKDDGYLPEAILNFIAFLGWNPGTEKEIYSLNELIADFSIEKIQKSAAIFNVDKLDWLNGFYIRKKSLYDLTRECIPYLIKANLIKEIAVEKYLVVETNEETHLEEIEKMVALYHERLKKLSEIVELIDFCFLKELDYSAELLKWKEMSNQEIIDSLNKSKEIITALEFNQENLEKELMEEANKLTNRGNLLWPLRVALSGKNNSAGPMEIAFVLGKEKTIMRIEQAIKKLK